MAWSVTGKMKGNIISLKSTWVHLPRTERKDLAEWTILSPASGPWKPESFLPECQGNHKGPANTECPTKTNCKRKCPSFHLYAWPSIYAYLPVEAERAGLWWHCHQYASVPSQDKIPVSSDTWQHPGRGLSATYPDYIIRRKKGAEAAFFITGSNVPLCQDRKK